MRTHSRGLIRPTNVNMRCRIVHLDRLGPRAPIHVQVEAASLLLHAPQYMLDEIIVRSGERSLHKATHVRTIGTMK